MTRAFIDTSVLLYLISGDSARADTVKEILAAKSVINIQVYNEFAAVARRKIGLALSEISEILTTISLVCGDPLALDFATHKRGLIIAERYKFSFYDSLIVAAAIEAKCHTLYCEDLQHGQIIADQLQIINPFKAAPKLS